MPKRSEKRITKTIVDALSPGQTVWDAELPGFGVAANRHSKTYKFKYYHKGKQRWLTVGQHGPLTVETARKLAFAYKAQVSAGLDPAAEKKAVALTVDELCREYMEKHALVQKKPGSAAMDRANIKNHILPLLGGKPVAELSSVDVERFKLDIQGGKTAPADPKQVQKAQRGGSPVTGGKGVANRCLALLSKMMSLAEKWGMRPKGTNPVSGVTRYKENPKERYLDPSEITRLWAALDAFEQEGDNGMYYPVALFRLLMLTGARVGEFQTLKWSMVDLLNGRLTLPDSKTGAKTIHLPPLAVTELKSLPHIKSNPYVFIGGRDGKHLQNVRKPWLKVLARAGLVDVRLHDLRHTWASLAVRNGLDLYVVGKMLGHKNSATTQRYAHLADEHLKETASRMGSLFEILSPKAAAAERIDL